RRPHEQRDGTGEVEEDEGAAHDGLPSRHRRSQYVFDGLIQFDSPTAERFAATIAWPRIICMRFLPAMHMPRVPLRSRYGSAVAPSGGRAPLRRSLAADRAAMPVASAM